MNSTDCRDSRRPRCWRCGDLSPPLLSPPPSLGVASRLRHSNASRPNSALGQTQPCCIFTEVFLVMYFTRGHKQSSTAENPQLWETAAHFSSRYATLHPRIYKLQRGGCRRAHLRTVAPSPLYSPGIPWVRSSWRAIWVADTPLALGAEVTPTL